MKQEDGQHTIAIAVGVMNLSLFAVSYAKALKNCEGHIQLAEPKSHDC